MLNTKVGKLESSWIKTDKIEMGLIEDKNPYFILWETPIKPNHLPSVAIIVYEDGLYVQITEADDPSKPILIKLEDVKKLIEVAKDLNNE